MTTFRYRIYVAIVASFAFVSTCAAQENPYELFNGDVVYNIQIGGFSGFGMGDGLLLRAELSEYPTDPQQYVPLADRLFEEVFLISLANSDVTVAQIWLSEYPTGDTGTAENIVYELGDDGIWRKTNHLNIETEESSFGSMQFVQLSTLSNDDVVIYYPPNVGHISNGDFDAIVVRMEPPAGVIGNPNRMRELLQAFWMEIGRFSEAYNPIAEGGPSVVLFLLAENLPEHRHEQVSWTTANIRLVD